MKTHRITCVTAGRLRDLLRDFATVAFTPGFFTNSLFAGKRRYANGRLGWIEETNTEIIESSLMFGAIQQQEWRIYEKPLL